MGRSRSRSRSPHGRRGGRKRSTSRERIHRRRKDVQRSRSRSRSPKHFRPRSISPRRRRSHSRSPRRRYNRSHSRSRSPGKSSKGIKNTSGPSGPISKDKLDAPVTEEDNTMMQLMGFCNFDTTKDKHVPGSNNASASTIKVNRRYRQYMNRRGGFNRPLDFIA